jgi:hypothetical protein
MDWNGIVLETETVEHGSTAVASSNPTRPFHTFTGWNPPLPNKITSNLTVTAQYAINTYNVFVEANPPNGGTVFGGGVGIPHKTAIAVSASPSDTHYFVNWTQSINNDTMSESSSYGFIVTETQTLVANFKLVTYIVTFVDWDGTELKLDIVEHGSAAIAPPNPTRTGYTFTQWNVPFDNITGNLTVTAEYTVNLYTVTVSTNPREAGEAFGGSTNIPHGTTIYLSAVPTNNNDCFHYEFVYWTQSGVKISEYNPYKLEVNENMDLVANFIIPDLDFDTYAETLWDNTFMLNLVKLRDDGYEITKGTRWFKDEHEEFNTRTINEFSYSAGPNKSDLLELDPTSYRYEITTENCGILSSTLKIITAYNHVSPKPFENELIVFPNPIKSGHILTLEGLSEGSQIQFFNRFGLLVKTAVATGDTTMFPLHLPIGVYLIYSENKQAKVIVK